MARVSLTDVKRFKRLLKQQQFHQFDGLKYQAPQGAGDLRTTLFKSRRTTVRYPHENTAQLPSALQSVIQAWTQIVEQP